MTEIIRNFGLRPKLAKRLGKLFVIIKNQLFIDLGIARVYDDYPNIDYCQECSSTTKSNKCKSIYISYTKKI